MKINSKLGVAALAIIAAVMMSAPAQAQLLGGLLGGGGDSGGGGVGGVVTGLLGGGDSGGGDSGGGGLVGNGGLVDLNTSGDSTIGVTGVATVTFGGNGRNGGPGTGIVINSSKLKLLLAMLQNRAWLRFAAGNAVCLPGHGVANIQGWLPQKDMAQMQQLVANYAQDIYTLRTMLSKCRSGGKAGAEAANRAIGVDIQNGMPVLFVL